MCGRYGHYLGKPSDKDGTDPLSSEIRKHFASDCESFGEELAAVDRTTRLPNNRHATIVALPRVGRIVPHKETLSRGCITCENYVKPQTVWNQTKISTGVCSARGSLVFDPQQAAKGCDFAHNGTPASETETIRLLPQYQEGFKVEAKRGMDAYVSAGGDIDPTEYETDMEVDSFWDELGVRAWRKVTHPETGKFTYLPIFKREAIPEPYRGDIPASGDESHPELFVDYSGMVYDFAVESWTLDEILCLVGAAGLGKTDGMRHVAWLMQIPFARFSFDKSSEKDDMLGYKEYDPKEGTFWKNGRVADSYENPFICLLDEFNLARGDCRQALRSAMDNSRQLVLDADHGLKLNRDPRTRMVVAINPSWDPNNLGTEELAGPELDRMSFSSVEYPPDAVERHIIRERCKVLDNYEISEGDLETIMRIAKDLRSAHDQGTLRITWGIRQQIKVARKSRWYNMEKAYMQASLNYVEPRTAEEALTHIRNHVV
jgi:MoxR-like ATPase